jgi:hypothetical protein
VVLHHLLHLPQLHPLAALAHLRVGLVLPALPALLLLLYTSAVVVLLLVPPPLLLLLLLRHHQLALATEVPGHSPTAAPTVTNQCRRCWCC